MRFNNNNIETTRSDDSLDFKPSGTGHLVIDTLKFKGNTISTETTNTDIELAAGSGIVNVTSALTIDRNIKIESNTIQTTKTNNDIVLTAAGSGSVQISSIDMNGGAADNVVIGAETPAAAAFTDLSMETLNADGISITNHVITSTSNADVELSTGATGNIIINGFTLPNTDGTVGQVLKTNGNGTLFFASHSSLYDHSFLEDATATVLGSSSSAQVVDTWSASTYRSVKYHIQISDATADRYRLIDANVTHDGVTAYISVFGGVDNGDGDGSSVYDTIDFSADISGGNVRLLGTVNNTNDQAIKLVRRVINT